MSTSEHRIAAGIYRGKGIAGSEQYGETTNGNDQIVVDLEFLDTGDRVSTFLVFSDKAAPYSLQRLRSLGWTGSDLADLTGIDSNEVEVEVRYEMYNGEEKMKVQIVTGGTVVLKNQFDAKGKKAFAAKYAALAKTTPVAEPRPVAKAKPQQAASAASDSASNASGDIPF